jgi:hypothetical protein
MKSHLLTAFAGALMASTLTIASVAVAGNGVGGVFNLGQVNTVNGKTELEGSTPNNSLFVIDQNGTAVPLDIQGPANKAPLKVNSLIKVSNLTADRLDGLDSAIFLKAYRLNINHITPAGPSNETPNFECEDPDDLVIGGSFIGVQSSSSAGGSVVEIAGEARWRVAITNPQVGVADSWTAVVVCADLDADGPDN